jgi:hypothetical protein
VVAIFDDLGSARQALDELRRVGFSDDQLGVISRQSETAQGTNDETASGSKWDEGAATGVAAGAGVGALWAVGMAAGALPGIGPAVAGGILASVLLSAAGTATVAGIIGGLIGLGIPEDRARCYDSEVRAGRTLVTVQAPGRYEEAEEILRRHGGHC